MRVVSPAPGGPENKAASVAHGAFGALPRALRGKAGNLDTSGAAERLQSLLLSWTKGVRLDEDEFASRFFGRAPDDRAARALHSAAKAIASARDQGDLRDASEQVATAMQAVGLDNWQRFLRDAQERADDPATQLAVAHSQPMPALALPAAKAAPPAVVPAADTTLPPASPAIAAEPEHGAVWQWLHSLGLTQTRHEQATELRRVMGSQGGLVYTRDGVPLNVDQMSDDEVLALDKEVRGQHAPPLIGAAAPIMTPWGWKDTPPYKAALKELRQPGTHETLNGQVPTTDEAKRMIKEIGGEFVRKEEGHDPNGISTHHDPHINYYTPGKPPLGGKMATVIVKPDK